MKILVGADHAGFVLKAELTRSLEDDGHEVLDVGTYSDAPVDYPDIAEKIGNAIVDAQASKGVLICGSGVGASVAANKLKGIRASVCHDGYSAAQGVEHDDMNLLVLGSRVIGVELARTLVRAFVSARFSNEERHLRRLQKVRALEVKGASR